MIISGIAMVIFDSRIIHKWIRKIKTRFRRNQQEENIELGQDAIPTEASPKTEEPESDPKPIRIDTDNNETSLSRRNQQASSQQDSNVDNSASRVRAEEVKMPYSIMTGVSIFLIFVTSFIVIMVIRGVIHNAPIAYKFFANMFLAGTSQDFSLMLIYFRNHYLRYYLSLEIYVLTYRWRVMPFAKAEIEGLLTDSRPVVIPLLSDYVVNTGFVSARDFLIGLVSSDRRILTDRT